MLAAVRAAAAAASLLDWALLAATLLAALYLLGTWNYDFFSRRGIPASRPWLPFLGNPIGMFAVFRSVPDGVVEMYQRGTGHGIYGNFELQKPGYIVRDPELLKQVTVKVFDHFTDHRAALNERMDPVFGRNLFSLRGEEWRRMRATLSPAFTSSKMKAMFPLIVQCGHQMTDHLKGRYKASPEGAAGKALDVDMKDLFSRMANDVIATVAFGLSCDSLQQPENKFYLMGKKITTLSLWSTLVFLGYILVPKLMSVFKFRVLNKEAMSFFESLVHETIGERQRRGIVRPDMLQLLMQARAGELKAEPGEEAEDPSGGAGVGRDREVHKLTDNDITAQAIIFFFAGFETVSTALCFTAIELATHPEVQERVSAEIEEAMREGGGNLSYEAVHGLKYLDMVISEALRLHPPVVFVDRQCVEPVTLPPSENAPAVHIRLGDVVMLPTFGLHRDPQYWPDPDRFDPERFSDENKASIRPFTYLPFGLGPRVCVGQRLALLEVKLALCHLLAGWRLEPSPRLRTPLRYTRGFNMMVEGGFWCGLRPRA